MRVVDLVGLGNETRLARACGNVGGVFHLVEDGEPLCGIDISSARVRTYREWGRPADEDLCKVCTGEFEPANSGGSPTERECPLCGEEGVILWRHLQNCEERESALDGLADGDTGRGSGTPASGAEAQSEERSSKASITPPNGRDSSPKRRKTPTSASDGE